MTPGKALALIICTFVSKVMSLLFNMLFRFIKAFLAKSKHLLISCLQSLSTVISGSKKRKSVFVSIFSLLFAVKWSKVVQSCPTFCNPMDCSLPGSSVPGIFQAIVLEWIAISFSNESSQPRDRTWVSHIVDRRFTVCDLSQKAEKQKGPV